MAQIQNPRKQFNFGVSISNQSGLVLNQFLVQQLTLPEVSIDVVEHGDANYMVKTGGIKRYTNLEMEKISFADGFDYWVWDWVRRIQDEFSGGGDLPSFYKRNCSVAQFDPSGRRIIHEWSFEGIWPNTISPINFSRTESENTMESISFSVDRMFAGPISAIPRVAISLFI